jgi:hypothetical protein
VLGLSASSPSSSYAALAAATAVQPVGSYGGDTSTTSPLATVDAAGEASQHRQQLTARQPTGLWRAGPRRERRIQAVDVYGDVDRRTECPQCQFDRAGHAGGIKVARHQRREAQLGVSLVVVGVVGGSAQPDLQ